MTLPVVCMVAACVAGALFLSACETLLTGPPGEGDTFDAPVEGLSLEQLSAFSRGDEGFGHVFTVAEGLGPIFNQPSCESCHPGDGKGHPRTTLFRFGMTSGGVTDPLVSQGGPQLQDHAIPGVSPEVLPAGVAVSPRTAPVVFGMGFIEAIPDSEILKHADEFDANGDGISGRPNLVSAPDYVGGGSGHIGRFGRKARVAFLVQQVVTAYRQDIGISTDYDPVEIDHPQAGAPVRDDVPEPELSAAVVNDVVFYLQTLAPPRRGPITTEVLAGGQAFTQAGCASCHVPTMTTGPHRIAALDRKDVSLYSDLLLHDMGPELADNFYEGIATGTEWRTTPLWGLRLVGEFTGGTPYYLHDGRTSDLTEVIRLHQGEADSARIRFFRLPAGEQKALLKFLESL